MKVLHGVGQPRLVYKTDVVLNLGNVLEIKPNYIRVSQTPNQSMINTAVYTTNNDEEDTWARITDVDVDNKLIYHTTFSNIFPRLNALAQSKYTVYDLPYSQNSLQEIFTPDFIVHTMYNGTKETTIRGWWYQAILDYSRKITAEEALKFANLFKSSRDYDVIFYPRLDNFNINYKVELDPESILNIAQKPFHRANKNFQIQLNGVARLSEVPLTLDGPKLIDEQGNTIVTSETDGDYIGVNQ